MICNLRHQKSVKKVKRCKKVKVKAFFFSRRSNRRRLPSVPSYLTNGFKSRVRHWLILNRDLEGLSSFFGNFSIAIFLSENAFLRKIRKQAKKKEGKKSLEDLAASVSPVIRKARCQTSKQWSSMIAKLQLFEPETALDIQRKENSVPSSLFFSKKAISNVGKKGK